MPLGSNTPQRRNAFRQHVAVVPRSAHILYGGVARRNVRLGVIELSASGVCVRSKDELRNGDLLELVFDLAPSPSGRGRGVREVHVQARVRRIVRGERLWDAGCAFEGIPESQAERIVKFVFAEQRATLRARRGAE
jgi:c-di-GMP-binding flagellar brake protein YcgR